MGRERLEERIRRGVKKLGLSDMFTILTIIMLLHVYTYVKTWQIICFKYVKLLCVNCTSIRLFKIIPMR